MPLHRKARDGEESPDVSARKKRAKARSHLMPLRASYQPSRFRWTITSVVHAPTKWCSLGRIAQSVVTGADAAAALHKDRARLPRLRAAAHTG